MGVGRPSSRKVTGSCERNALCAERTAWSSASSACADDIPAGRSAGTPLRSTDSTPSESCAFCRVVPAGQAVP